MGCDCSPRKLSFPGLGADEPDDVVYKGMFSMWELAFREEIQDRIIHDPKYLKADWFSLAAGWALGRGFTPRSAYAFAQHLRYHTDLG